MNWHYYDGTSQVGPISEAELLQARHGGVINDGSLVWREGMPNWIPLREALPAAAGAAGAAAAPQFTPGAGQAQCCQCGGYFSQEDMLPHAGLFVCANCKPIFLQRIREGATDFSPRLVGGVTEAQIRERDYEHVIGEYFNRSWALFKSDTGLIMGACVLIGLCLFVANGTPYLSSILSLIFTGPLLGGLYVFFLKKCRNQPATLGDAFSGFGPRFGQMLLGHFVPTLLASLAMIPGVIIFVIAMFAAITSSPGSGGPSAPFVVLLIAAGLMVFISLGVMIYFNNCWLFTLCLVVDKSMTFWPAMALSRAVVRKHWWQTFLLAIVIGLILLAGFLMCGLGLLVAAPVACGVLMFAYNKLFGDMQPAG